MDIEVESTGNDYSSYYYSLEILKIFKHLKGKTLLSYVIKDTGSAMDASSYLNIFQCEDCSLYVWRRRSGAIFESCWQRVYFSAPKMDWAFLEQVAEFMGRFGDEAEYSYDINKVVDDIILEIGIREVEGKLEEKVINVILKFSDNYLAPYLHAYELPFGCMPSKKDDKIYYSTLEEYKLKACEGFVKYFFEESELKFISLEEFLSNHAIGQKDKGALS